MMAEPLIKITSQGQAATHVYSPLGEGHCLVQRYPGAEGSMETSRRVSGNQGIPVRRGDEVLP